jgi:hypothetical protein
MTNKEPKLRVWLGLDPGANGGFAALDPDGAVTLSRMPTTDYDLWNLVSEYGRHSDKGVGYVEVLALIEQIVPRPTKWFNFQIGRTQESILRSTCDLYGQYRAACAMLAGMGIPYRRVRPQEWMRFYGLSRDKGEKDSTWKNRLKAFAQTRFPDAKLHLYSADALLLADFGRREMRTVSSPEVQRQLYSPGYDPH